MYFDTFMLTIFSRFQNEEEGFHIDDFDIQDEKFLGEGSCGSTYRCRCERNSKFYALKKTRSNANIDEDTEKEVSEEYV